MVEVIQFPDKEKENAPLPGSDQEMIMATLENLMTFQERLETGMKLLTAAFEQSQARIRDLEHQVENLRKPKRPVILNSTGARAN